MKKPNSILSLNKETISKLSDAETSKIKGGIFSIGIACQLKKITRSLPQPL